MATQTAAHPAADLRPSATRRHRRIIALFLASGAAGLIYQVVWSRELVLVFGNTTQAIATIVTAFMAGLGLGGWVGGRWAARTRRPLAAYGAVELGVAALALALPLGFGAIGDLYRAAYPTLDTTALTALRFALALVAVTPATFLMGMTLPLLTQALVQRLDDAGRQLGELYATNTLGAVLGTLLAGFVLIEELGLTGTSLVAVALTVLAGGGALALARSAGAAAPTPHPSPEGGGESDGRSDLSPTEEGESDGLLPNASLKERQELAAANSTLHTPHSTLVILAATFVSGFVALALEVLWTRMLAEGSGARIYIFVAILAIYLIGIAEGSLIYRRRSNATRDTMATLGGCFAGIGLAAAVTVVVGSGWLGNGPWAGSYLILIPATVFMGYAFPLSGRLITPSVAQAGRSIGLLYTWNTLGSILGSAAAAFLLAAWIGTNGSILLLAAVSLGLGAALIAADPRRLPQHRPAVASLLVLAGLMVGAGAARLPLTRTVTENALERAGLSGTHREDNLATVDSVGGAPAQRRLYVGGVGMTALTIDTKLMAYLPHALRPAATDALVIAFGMGSTYRSDLILGLHTDVVELSPSVPGQMPVFYPDAAHYLQHPNGRIIIADGRNYVRVSRKQYDMIAVDPAPPIQSAGTVVLYTQEFLTQGKARLKPDGVFMLWVPYDETLPDFKDHLRTFRAVFPHMEVLFGPGKNGVFMLGSAAPLTWDAAGIRTLFDTPSAQADLATAPDFAAQSGAAWAATIAHLRWLAAAQVDAFVGPGPLITDDRPRTEYYLLRSLRADKTYVSEPLLRAATDQPAARP